MFRQHAVVTEAAAERGGEVAEGEEAALRCTVKSDQVRKLKQLLKVPVQFVFSSSDPPHKVAKKG